MRPLLQLKPEIKIAMAISAPPAIPNIWVMTAVATRSSLANWMPCSRMVPHRIARQRRSDK
jgi:hypothetical protein